MTSEEVAWLTTAGGDGQPQSSPVWFWWHDGAIWVRSQPTAGKIRNIRANERVAFHLGDDGHGGDIVTIEGRAELLESWPGDVQQGYLAKYDRGIREALSTTPEQLEQEYSTVVRITPTRARAW